jgi:hypothetical protein
MTKDEPSLTVKFIEGKLAGSSAVSLRLAMPDWLRADCKKAGIKVEPEPFGYWRFSRV